MTLIRQTQGSVNGFPWVITAVNNGYAYKTIANWTQHLLIMYQHSENNSAWTPTFASDRSPRQAAVNWEDFNGSKACHSIMYLEFSKCTVLCKSDTERAGAWHISEVTAFTQDQKTWETPANVTFLSTGMNSIDHVAKYLFKPSQSLFVT